MRRAVLLLCVGCNAGELEPFATGAATDSASGSASSGDTGDVTTSGIVYVRCVRTQQPLEVTADVVVAGATVNATRTFHHVDVYDVLPTAERSSDVVAPCDLVWRDDEGETEVLHDCSSTSTDADACIAIDPTVSHDGTKLAYVVLHGPRSYRSEQLAAQVLRPDAEPAALDGVTLPNPRLSPIASTLVVLELASGTRIELPGRDGEIRRSPTFLHDGRIAFAASMPDVYGTAVRDGDQPWSATEYLATGLFVVAADGSDLERVGAHDLAATRAPLQLGDGRIAVVATQRIGALPFRYTNGAPGSPGAFHNVHHLYAQDPDGARLTALFGQHTHLWGGAFNHTRVLSMTQHADGRLLFVEGDGPFGSGSLRAFAPDPDGREGPAPHTVDPGDVFRPADMVALTPWASSPLAFGSPLPPPAIVVPGYADPLLFAGRVRDPSVAADDTMLLAWAKGGCSDSGSDVGLLGDPPPPFTNGTGQLAPLNALELFDLDNPACDVGIFRADALPIAHPAELVPIVDTTAYHEIMPRRIASYADVYGAPTPTPIAPAHRRATPDAALPFGTPFAILGGSSLLQHETRSFDDNPFGSEVSWALQGAETSEWTDDDVCGVRVAALAPNVAGDGIALQSAMGHRMRVLAELPVRKTQGGATVLDPLGDADTSFRMRVPADTPLVIAGIDCEGRTLTASQVPFSLRAGEDRTCGGCHVRSTLPLRFEETAAAGTSPELAGEGVVTLLAGGDLEDTLVEAVDGFGVDFELARDVAPIFAARCVECHGGADPAAGLPLDLAGSAPGSTWWRLAADFTQSFVPIDAQVPVMGVLRKPQLSRFVRFHSARGSLLYWKAANARTDGRSDADADDDVDFGADHPTTITAAELRVLARWIDTGAAAGAAVLQDTWPPIVVARIAAAAPDVLVIGTADVGAGIDADSLGIEWWQGDGWIEVVAPTAAIAGVVEVALDAVPDDATLRVHVRDDAGNESVLTRSRAALLEP
ncbi:MAG TPA: hypothetical protein VG755_12290 [Nannocystaceae bacterium]|nr:hypothetical protein [Nannocystaceae bacterium]